MVLVNLMWILRNLADIVPPAKRLRIRELITTWESSLRNWEGVEKGDKHHQRQVESALATFVSEVKLAVGSRVWELNMRHMRSAITAAKLTESDREQQRTTKDVGKMENVVSGFKKTMSCVMTWEKLLVQTEGIRAPTVPMPTVRTNAAGGIEKKRAKETHPQITRAPSKRSKKLPEEKLASCRLSLQLLEGGVNGELTELASQDESSLEFHSPARVGTPQRWMATTSMRHNHSGDMPQYQWWPDAAVAATEDSWWLESVWNHSSTFPVCGHCMWTILVNMDKPYEQLDFGPQSFVTQMVNYVNISADEHDALCIFKYGDSVLEG